MADLAHAMERTTGFEPATPDLGKVVLYQLSHVRVVGGTRFELVTPTVSR